MPTPKAGLRPYFGQSIEPTRYIGVSFVALWSLPHFIQVASPTF
jgi:hypothetical protein